jgi:hypothetical protein
MFPGSQGGFQGLYACCPGTVVKSFIEASFPFTITVVEFTHPDDVHTFTDEQVSLLHWSAPPPLLVFDPSLLSPLLPEQIIML